MTGRRPRASHVWQGLVVAGVGSIALIGDKIKRLIEYLYLTYVRIPR